MSVIVNVMEMFLLDKNNCYLVEEDLLQNALKVIYHSMSDLIDFLSEAKVNSNFEMILDCEESELYFLKLENCLLAAQTLCLVTKINDYIKSNLFHPKFNESIEFLVSRYVKFTNTKELVLNCLLTKIISVSIHNYPKLFQLASYDKFVPKIAHLVLSLQELVENKEKNNKAWNAYYITIQEFVSIILLHEFLEKSHRDFLKKKLQLIYMEILSVNVEDIANAIWSLKGLTGRSVLYEENKVNFWLDESVEFSKLKIPLVPDRYLMLTYN